LELPGAEFLELKAMEFDLRLTGFDARHIDRLAAPSTAAATV
jgi:hypothetical protein